MPDYKDIFNNIFIANKWGDSESKSGSGSNLEQTSYIRNILPKLLSEHKIKTLLDLPCGDFNWMKETVTELSKVIDKYTGGDLLHQLIFNNQSKYGNEKFEFKKIDLLYDNLSSYDLIFNRDCLVHFSYKNIYRALRNVKKSKSIYLLTTTFPGSKNKDIKTGHWRTIDLQAYPFCMSQPLLLIDEKCSESGNKYFNKSLGLWKINDIPIIKIFMNILIYKTLLLLYFPIVFIKQRLRGK